MTQQQSMQEAQARAAQFNLERRLESASRSMLIPLSLAPGEKCPMPPGGYPIGRIPPTAPALVSDEADGARLAYVDVTNMDSW